MPLAAAEEIPKQVPLKPMAHVQSGPAWKTICSLPCPPSPLQALPALPALQSFPRQDWRELQTKLLSPRASSYMSDEIRFKAGSVLCSADPNQTKICVMWDMTEVYLLYASPNGPVTRCLRQGYQGS